MNTPLRLSITSLCCASLFGTAGCGGNPRPEADGGEDAATLATDAGQGSNLDGGSDGGSDAGGNDAGTGADGGSDGGQDAGAPVTGASQAICAGGVCQHGILPTETGAAQCQQGPQANGIVGLGVINNGAPGGDECRLYGFYRPANLQANAGDPPAAAIFIADPSGALADDIRPAYNASDWGQVVADQNRLVLILLSRPKLWADGGAIPTTGHVSSWFHPNIDVPDPGANAPSDEPYITAVLNDAITRLNLDPERLYFTGGSSGATMTYDVACDPVNSARFRGYAPISAGMSIQISSGGQPMPGTERCPSTNTSFFFTFVDGNKDGSTFNGVCLPQSPSGAHCIGSFAETASFWAGHLGCSPSAVSTPFGTPQQVNRHDDYAGCSFGVAPTNFLRAVEVLDGGHSWTGLDAKLNGHLTNAYDTASDNWAFWSAGQWVP